MTSQRRPEDRATPPAADRPSRRYPGTLLNGSQRRRNLITLLVLIILVVGLFVALPGLHGVTKLLSRVTPGWIALAFTAEVLSCVGYVIAFQQVFPRVPTRTAARIAWAEMAFQTVFPAGGAGGLALGGWILHQKGAPWARIAERSTVLFLLTSAINVFTVTIFGLLLALGIFPGHHRLLLGALPAAVGAAVIVFALAVPRKLTSTAPRRSWKRRRLQTTLEGLAESIRDTEQFLRGGDWKLLGAVGYLAFDISVLWICFLAFGHAPNAAALVLGYQIGYIANAIPIPGGIGALDGGLIGALVLYGANATHATAAVLLYHAIWLIVPLLIGTVAFLLVRRHLDEPLPALPTTATSEGSG